LTRKQFERPRVKYFFVVIIYCFPSLYLCFVPIEKILKIHSLENQKRFIIVDVTNLKYYYPHSHTPQDSFRSIRQSSFKQINEQQLDNGDGHHHNERKKSTLSFKICFPRELKKICRAKSKEI
jgi:hypothetical protein